MIAPRPDASHWYAYHLRQALWFGLLCGVVGLFAFAWPLAISLFMSSVIGTIAVYVFAMVVDAALFVLWLTLAVRYSQRAGRGELFEIPWVARLTGTTIPK
jgi:hypothetical protein